MRIRNTVGADQTIVTEVIVRSVKTVEISSVSIDHHAVFSFPAAGLVNEIPDKSTLQIRIFTDQIPIFFETTLRVTHCMGIFTLNQWFGSIGTLTIFFHAVIIIVHRTEDIGMFYLACLFILAGTARVFCFNPFIALFEVGAVTGFITQ